LLIELLMGLLLLSVLLLLLLLPLSSCPSAVITSQIQLLQNTTDSPRHTTDEIDAAT
jgi:hypothetical protein